MKRSAMKYLVCACCGGDLELFNFGNGGEESPEVMHGQIICAKCGQRHLVIKGVPRMMLPDSLTNSQKQTGDTFTKKWQSIPKYGYDPASEAFKNRWYLERYGWTQESFDVFIGTRQMVLDAGTGLGSHVSLYAGKTSAQVFGIDIGDCVDVAYERTRELPNAHILQSDLTNQPFRRGQFDFIASDQVLHHTPNTERSFKYLVSLLAPGGEIAIYVYKKKAALRELVDDYLRNITTRMTWDECVEFCEQVTLLGKALTEMKTVVDIEKDIPLLDIKAGKQDVQRFVYWNVLKCFWNPDFDLKTNVMVNVDWYHPVYAWRHTPAEVEGWFRDMGLKIMFERVEESGVSVRGRK